MKKSKFLVASGMALTLLAPSFSCGIANAETNVNEPEKVIPYNGTTYEPSSTNTYSQVGWTYLHKNPSSVTDTVAYNVSRTKSATASVGTSTEFGLMKTGVGFSAEVSLNSSTTISYTVTYSIPPYTTYLLRAGSQKVKTNGNLVKYSNGLASSSKYVTGDWSYRGFSDKIKQ